MSAFLDGEVYKGRATIRTFWESQYEEVWENVNSIPLSGSPAPGARG